MDEHPDELAAAIAAMRAEWAEIGPEVRRPEEPELLDEERAEMMLRRTALLREFWSRHGAALQALNPNAAMADFAPLDAKEQVFLRAAEHAREVEEKLLHAVADMAESLQALSEEGLEALHKLEGYSAEDWAAMDEGQRSSTFDFLRTLQEQRAEMLAALPADRRRYWETR